MNFWVGTNYKDEKCRTENIIKLNYTTRDIAEQKRKI